MNAQSLGIVVGRQKRYLSPRGYTHVLLKGGEGWTKAKLGPDDGRGWEGNWVK